MIEAGRNCINSTVLYSAAGIGAAALVGGLIMVAVAKPATATPAYAAQTNGLWPVPRESSRWWRT